ncbi:P [Taro vein chlorosis virus]|uniref:Phosphoprotein n=1 Tax=Taro vein chlorosis virus TaxID=2749935 RepID=PHOSP_TAVCV|nr:P [Taro vein chlorosis virus] [Taro vein chlorosis virus]Q5GA89.1 RecName: Full=Phosphoprotein; Short=Protein P; AltName: Full=Protein M1 [Alphanucleorhabdovirus colocasiae]AAV92083.1 P [Taro vein chlorosis virus] [Taro vein chlorosis virus]
MINTSRRSSRNKPATPAPELIKAEENPSDIHEDFADLPEPLLLSEARAENMPAVGSAISDLLKVERAAPLLIGNTVEEMVTGRLADRGLGELTEREKIILAIGIHCGESSMEHMNFLVTKRWITEELKTQLTSLAATTRALTEAGSLHRTYALLQSPDQAKKQEALDAMVTPQVGIDITTLNHEGLEDIWQSYSHDAKVDAVDDYLRNILNVDPTPLYAEDEWGRHIAFIPRWQLVAYGKNSDQFKTVYADEINYQRESLERILAKRVKLN